MSATFYTSLSGMLAASYGLQNTSNNVANMQSPGFKRTDVFYSSLGNGSEDGLGSGVRIGGTNTDFSNGTCTPTGSPSDLAIVGPGFFVVRLKSGELIYTRDGEFNFNKDGFLVDKHSDGLVQGYNNFGDLVPIHEKGPKLFGAKPTHELFIQGHLVRELNSESQGPMIHKYHNINFTLDKIYDNEGKPHKVTFEFQSPLILASGADNTPENDNTWELVTITEEGNELSFAADQKIKFNMQSGAEFEHSSIKFNLNATQEITLSFGTLSDNADNSVQIIDKDSNFPATPICTFQNDGYIAGNQIGFSFDENGRISYNYDNGKDTTGIQLALARFDDMEHNLVQTKDNLYRAKSSSGTHLGRANSDGFGSIKDKNLENSNVNSNIEFANIVILQRLFQACSQIMDIDKQLFENLEAK